MALMFPQVFPGETGTDATVFAALRSQLDDEWYVFYGRELTVGEDEGRFDFILLHRDHGIAIAATDVATEAIDAAPTAAFMRRYLEQLGFPAIFAKPPAIVVLGLVAPFDDLQDALLARFAASPRTKPNDPDWVEWLADRLTVPADLVATSVPVPDEALDADEQPDFSHAAAPDAAEAAPGEALMPRRVVAMRDFRLVASAAAEAAPAEDLLPHPAAMAASDRRLVQTLGALTLVGALIGAVALAETGFSGPSSAVGATEPTAAVDPVTPPASIVPPPAVAERPAEPQPVVTEAAPDDKAPPAAVAQVHKPHRKHVAVRHRRRGRSFWDQVASVFH
jgi:hypothetical protein